MLPPVSLGSEQEVHRVAVLVNSTVQLLPLACHFDVGLVHFPTVTNRAFTAATNERHDRQNFQGPAMHGGVINKDAAFLHHFVSGLSTTPLRE